METRLSSHFVIPHGHDQCAQSGLPDLNVLLEESKKVSL
jgi:hypothetical protein